MSKPAGQLIQADFFANVGGINTSDTPFMVRDDQATGGVGFNYIKTGGIRKRFGHEKLNSSADTQLRSLGLSQWNSNSGSRFQIRTAGTKWQNIDPSAGSFTNLTEDTTTAGSDFLTSGSEQPVVFSQFNTSTVSLLWGAGGGQTGIYGAYSTSKVTKNGVSPPGGSVTPSVGGSGGSWTTGTYRYAFALRKASTQAISNVAVEVSATVSNATDEVTLPLNSLTGIDTTQHDKIYIYRSAVSGAVGFTTGDLVGQADSDDTSFVDLGSYISTSQNIPRGGGTVDNTALSDGTYNVVTTFKRRLVTALNNVLYISDINKSESWPTANVITVPSGGPITGLEVISFTSASANTLDEILCIFKEKELWVLTGDSSSDWVLKFIDVAGAINQSSIVQVGGFLAWVSNNGIYLWNGAGKPIYISRPIESIFQADGEIDVSKLNMCHGAFLRKENQIIWWLSHSLYGEQKFAVKLDLRLSLLAVQDNLDRRIADGVFTFDSSDIATYSSKSLFTTSQSIELLYLGDASGFIYSGYTGHIDSASDYDFEYLSKFHDCGSPGQSKRFHKVIVWIEELGDWNITLDYWTDYFTADNLKTTQALPISTVSNPEVALWDIATWDVSIWDDYLPKSKALIFNLGSGVNNSNEGDCIRLQFRNSTANQPITILGYSIIYSMKGLAK